MNRIGARERGEAAARRRSHARSAWVPLLAGVALLVAGPAFAGSFAGNNFGDAGNNNSPPAGAILDLGGAETGTAPQSVNHGTAIEESVSFVGGLTTTDITFAFRDDPAFISFSNVALIDTTTSSGNLILNGDFSKGTYINGGGFSAPVDWNYANVYGVLAGGVVSSSCGGGLANCWQDGAVQGYDAIDQDVATKVGDAYTLSFFYSDDSQLTTMSDLSTNGNTTDSGGNGIDILAYAQAGLPPGCPPGQVCTSVPEPSSFKLVAFALFGLGLMRRKFFA